MSKGFRLSEQTFPARKAEKLMNTAREELAVAQEKATRALAVAEAELKAHHSTGLVKYQAQGPEAYQAALTYLKEHDPAYKTRFDELSATLEQPKASYITARTRYLTTDAGMSELQTQEQAARDALDTPNLRSFRQDLEAKAAAGRTTINAKFASQLAATRGTEHENRVKAAYAQALSTYTPEATESKYEKEVFKRELALAKTRGQLAQARHIRSAEASAVVARLHRENAIREAVRSAGGSQDAAENLVLRDRERSATEPGVRRRAVTLPAEQRRNKQVRIHVTPEEGQALEAEAKARGISVAALVNERLSGSPQARFAPGGLAALEQDFRLYRSGLPHRPRTTGAGERRERLVVVAASPAMVELQRQRAASFSATMSSYGRTCLLGTDPRQVQNDRSQMNRDLKKKRMAEKHASPEQSLRSAP